MIKIDLLYYVDIKINCNCTYVRSLSITPYKDFLEKNASKWKQIILLAALS